jgi:hypothetical protein
VCSNDEAEFERERLALRHDPRPCRINWPATQNLLAKPVATKVATLTPQRSRLHFSNREDGTGDNRGILVLTDVAIIDLSTYSIA